MSDKPESSGSDLPILQEAEVALPAPADIAPDATIGQAKQADVAVANDMLRICYAGLNEVKSLGQLSRMVSTTMDVLEKRRKLMCLDYGPPRERSQGHQFDPLD